MNSHNLSKYGLKLISFLAFNKATNYNHLLDDRRTLSTRAYSIKFNRTENGDFKDIENGIIELIDIGDAQSWNIVVEGDKRGEMWFYTDVGIQPACPAMSFSKWFEYWLDGGTDYFYEFQYN